MGAGTDADAMALAVAHDEAEALLDELVDASPLEGPADGDEEELPLADELLRCEGPGSTLPLADVDAEALALDVGVNDDNCVPAME